MIKIEIGNTVPQKNPKNTFEVQIDYSHGDADFEETESRFIMDMKYLLATLEAVSVASKYDSGQEASEIRAAVDARLVERGYDSPDLKNWVHDLFKYDKVFETSQALAHMYGAEVFYWDNDGVKKFVHVLGD